MRGDSIGKVHADSSVVGQGEEALLLAPFQSDVMESMKAYDAAEVACEQGAGDAQAATFGCSTQLEIRWCRPRT